jgi:surface antigen
MRATKPLLFAIAAAIAAVTSPYTGAAQTFGFAPSPSPFSGRDYGYGPFGPANPGSSYAYGPFGPAGLFSDSHSYRFRFGAPRGKALIEFERRAFGADYLSPEFSDAYFGPYGEDPVHFERAREEYRARQDWNEPYAHDYVLADDPFYAACAKDLVAGERVFAAILAAGSEDENVSAATVFESAPGKNLATELNCEDRLIVYSMYSDALETKRPLREYSWRNPTTSRSGILYIDRYYRDEDGYDCASYRHTLFANGRQLIATGRACRQDGGVWAVLG